MPHLVISSGKRQRPCCPHQLTLEIDDDDHDAAPPLGSHAINADGKIDSVDMLTLRNYYLRVFCNLGQLACKDIATI